MDLESLTMVVAQAAPGRGPGPAPKYAAEVRSLGARLAGLLGCAHARLQGATFFLPWLLFLPSTSFGPGLCDFGSVWDCWLVTGLGLMLTGALGAAAFRDHLQSSAGAGPMFTVLACVLWHLGLSDRGPASGDTDKWRVAVVHGGRPPLPVGSLHTAVGLMLLDDVLRAVLRFVGSVPFEAWPFAAASRESYFLWVHDEDWWEQCYRRVSWMRLPANPNVRGGSRHTNVGQLLSEASLWASMAIEALGTMAILPPKCAGPVWVPAPCAALTVFVVSCVPWLPRLSDIVLVEMLQLMRTISKFQAVWIVVIGLSLRSEDIAPGEMPKDCMALFLLEACALVVLYLIVVRHLWAVTKRCRVASPLQAVPAADIVSSTTFRSRPLYCGSLGVVEGSHAPTRLCDWDNICNVRWRDRFALRRCAESLASREAHLLSHLDALGVRISEAEREECCSLHCAPDSTPRAWFLSQGSLNGVLAVIVMALCAVAARGWWSSRFGAHAVWPADSAGNAFKAVLWAALFLRVGRCWYSIMTDGISAWEALVRIQHVEVSALRQQAHTLHSSLAATQQMLSRLELQLRSLGVPVLRRASGSRRLNSAAAAATLLPRS